MESVKENVAQKMLGQLNRMRLSSPHKKSEKTPHDTPAQGTLSVKKNDLDTIEVLQS